MLAEQFPWWLSDAPRVQRPGSSEDFYVFVGDSIQDVVVFLGFREPTAPAGIKLEGTGFLLHHDGSGYLVTAHHVAEKLTDTPFVIRANRHKGPAELLDIDLVKWHFPRDQNIDLAITAVTIYAETGRGPLVFPTTLALNESKIKELVLGIGDTCYTVALFHFIAGHKRNLPLVYTGNVALMPPPGETIPVGNNRGGTDFVEAYLIESGAINGASGAPVFVRSSIQFNNLPVSDSRNAKPTNQSAIVADNQIYLLGLFQAAWFLPPDVPLMTAIKAKPGDIVPVGLGVVVPASKILDLLEREDVKKERQEKPTNAARMTSVSASGDVAPPADDANPNHLEDFRRLVDVAARKRPQGDQT
jgi:Trypsin-like peptidase domain